MRDAMRTRLSRLRKRRINPTDAPARKIFSANGRNCINVNTSGFGVVEFIG
jgi:hypothetical protein